MPDQDVLGAIGEKSEVLLHKVTENAELCQAVMGIVSLLALTANERGCDLGGVVVGRVRMLGLAMVAPVKFNRSAVRRQAEAIACANSFMHFLKAEAHGLYLFIAKNPDILVWLRDVVEKMEAHASAKGIAFSDITFGNVVRPRKEASVIIDKEDNIVMEMDP